MATNVGYNVHLRDVFCLSKNCMCADANIDGLTAFPQLKYLKFSPFDDILLHGKNLSHLQRHNIFFLICTVDKALQSLAPQRSSASRCGLKWPSCKATLSTCSVRYHFKTNTTHQHKLSSFAIKGKGINRIANRKAKITCIAANMEEMSIQPVGKNFSLA